LRYWALPRRMLSRLISRSSLLLSHRLAQFILSAWWPRKVTHGVRRTLPRWIKFDAPTVLSTYDIHPNGILHVGAHRGQEVEEYVSRSPRVMLIEPSDAAFSHLLAHYGSTPGVTLVNAAAGSTTGPTLLYIASNDGQSSSLLRPLDHLIQVPSVTFNSAERVDVIRLDDLLEPNHDCNFWVLDTQGSEHDVLQGGAASLRNVDFVFAEINRAELYAGCAQVMDLDAFLHATGFSRVLTRWWGCSGDALYIRKGVELYRSLNVTKQTLQQARLSACHKMQKNYGTK